MVTLQTLTDTELTDYLKKLVGQERKILIQIIEHLEEVDRRKLFAKRGYSSLFEYCTKELGYSAASAQRRISSMRVSVQVPEIKEDIKSGALTLSSVAMADTFFRHEAKQGKSYDTEKKAGLLKELVGKTTRQVEEKFVNLSPKFIQRKEQERVITAELTEIKITFNNEQLKKLKRLKELGVSKGRLTNAELFEWAIDIAINRVDPMEKAQRAHRRDAKKQQSLIKEGALQTTEQTSQLTEETNPSSREYLLANPLPKRKSRCIPNRIRHEVFVRDGGQCTFNDPLTGNQCCSQRNLEVDHIHPYALGGEHSLENLRLLCKAHNQLRAQQTFRTLQRLAIQSKQP